MQIATPLRMGLLLIVAILATALAQTPHIPKGDAEFDLELFGNDTLPLLMSWSAPPPRGNNTAPPEEPIVRQTFRTRLRGEEADKGLPEYLDYRYSNTNPYGVEAVTMAKKQMRCPSCWAFAATGVLEGQDALRGRGLDHLSPQQLVDCLGTGCSRGNNVDNALAYTYRNGIVPWSAYPYVARYNGNSVCRRRTAASAYPYLAYSAAECNEEGIKQALYDRGPMAISVNFGGEGCKAFVYYKGGVFRWNQDCLINGFVQRTRRQPTASDCRSFYKTSKGHAMLLVGYGTSQDGIKYWILKNSWGEEWGYKGYMYMERGALQCGTSCMAHDPVFAAVPRK